MTVVASYLCLAIYYTLEIEQEQVQYSLTVLDKIIIMNVTNDLAAHHPIF